jgi:hypothetical protein
LATEYTLRRPDGQPLGSFAEVQALLRRLAPGVEFGWTTGGTEKVRQAAENGVELPDDIRRWMESLPALLEGAVETEEYLVTIGLGHEEPVPFLVCEPHGEGAELERLLAALEAEVGGELMVFGTDPALEEHFKKLPVPPLSVYHPKDFPPDDPGDGAEGA